MHAPLLLMTDQEGGFVRRLPGAPVLSEKQIGESASPAAAAAPRAPGPGTTCAASASTSTWPRCSTCTARPGDFIDQFQRSYSSNPHVVSRLGSAFITAQQKAGVAATAKHFPGLGAATAPRTPTRRRSR